MVVLQPQYLVPKCSIAFLENKKIYFIIGQWSVDEPKDTGLEGDLALILKVNLEI